MAIPIGLNAALALATSALGIRLDPYMPFNFLVEMDGLLVGGFKERVGDVRDELFLSPRDVQG